MFDLTGRTALVTGATGGIGNAIAQALHAQGATVAISGTRREVLDGFAANLGDRVHVLPCNLSDSAAVEALVPAAEAANASLAPAISFGPATDTPTAPSAMRLTSPLSTLPAPISKNRVTPWEAI